MHQDHPATAKDFRRAGSAMQDKIASGIIDRLSAVASRIDQSSNMARNTLNAIRGPVPEAADDPRTAPQAAPTLHSVCQAIERRLEDLEAQLRELSQAF